MGLEQELEIELIRMQARDACRIKTTYSKGDMKEEFSLDKEKYLMEKANFNNRGLQPR
jgi:hypothetical protein